jgi:hypothetical protein
MTTLIQDEIEITLGELRKLRKNGYRQSARDERLILALLMIDDDLHHIRGLIESLVLALSDLRTR